MKARRLNSFKEDFDKLPPHIQQLTREKFRLFMEDSRHPSLRLKKMKGYDNIWEGHITLGYVFTMQWQIDDESGEEIAIFRRIGKHDETYDHP
jgi:mRNA-degrading endonuclease RelE of RelBE toxin-antitoxin system